MSGLEMIEMWLLAAIVMMKKDFKVAEILSFLPLGVLAFDYCFLKLTLHIGLPLRLRRGIPIL